MNGSAGTSALGHLPIPVLFQDIGNDSPGWALQGRRRSPGTEVQQDGAAGSQSGLCWALRGAEVVAGGCFSLFPPIFPCFPS